MNKQRWDIRIGLFASGLAIAGLISSISVGNHEAFGQSGLARSLQTTLLFFALVIGGITLAKWWQAKRSTKR